ncbi:MAG: Fic family protein [Oscillospiraceae bacterium]|nr:Fic family protein [Oscillospiraceae bacterium]
MEQKYRMTRMDNIFVAKRNIVDYIWKSAKLEGLTVTYPDTDAIYNGMSVANVPVDEIIAVNNLKHAWHFVLDNLDYTIDYPYICQIHRLVGGDTLIRDAGRPRKIPVRIGGTSWTPDIPIEAQIKEQLADVQSTQNHTEKAIMLTLYLMRKQIFLDGNKRMAMLAGNQVMIASGSGIISVPIEHQPAFRNMLITFYESGDSYELGRFLYENCIDGMDFEEEIAEKSSE